MSPVILVYTIKLIGVATHRLTTTSRIRHSLILSSNSFLETDMIVVFNSLSKQEYKAPACDFCEHCAESLLCQSGQTRDWEYDNNGF